MFFYFCYIALYFSNFLINTQNFIVQRHYCLICVKVIYFYTNFRYNKKCVLTQIQIFSDIKGEIS